MQSAAIDYELKAVLVALLHRLTRPLHDVGATISDSDRVTIQKDGYAHVFLLSPVDLIVIPQGMAGDDTIALPVTKNVWANVTFDDSISLVSQGQATPVNIILRYTNEVVP